MPVSPESPLSTHEMTYSPYMVVEEQRPDPWSKKMMPKMHARRISFDSVLTKSSSHSRSPSVDSALTGRRKLQKSTSSNSGRPPSLWSPLPSSTDKPLPSLPIWHPQGTAQLSEEERQQRIARATEARTEWIRRDQLVYMSQQDGVALSVRPKMPDLGDSFVLERPRRRATASKKGWRFYCEAFVNYRENRRNSKVSSASG